MRFIFSDILLLLVGSMSISSIVGITDLQNMERNKNYIIKEIAIQINRLGLIRPYNYDAYCCNGQDGVCNIASCDMSLFISCRNVRTQLRSFTYNVNSNPELNLNFRISDDKCFRFNVSLMWFANTGSGKLFEEVTVPLIRPARKILTLNKTEKSPVFDIHVYYTQNCDIKVGSLCEKECLPNNPNQRCDPVTGEIMCRLLYSGPECQDDFDPCKENPCLNLGKCEAKNGLHKCKCFNGYTGESCETRPCLPGDCYTGTCLLGTVTCTTSSLYNLGFNQFIQCPEKYCYNGGECKALLHAIMCDCTNTGAAGKRCEHKCVPKCVHGVCDLFKGRPICACDRDYNGEVCDKVASIKKCPVDNPCLHGGYCVDGVGQDPYSCNCPSMWTGRVCEVYSCNLKNCRNGLCLENNLCRCNKNFFGELCQYESCGRNELCKNKGTCQQSSLYGVSCHCGNDYTGKHCEYTCKKGCGIYGKCKLTHSGPKCECDQNHHGEDCSSLIETAECRKLNCLNKGVCTQNKFSYVCECNEHWKGLRCELPTCSANTCDRGVCLLNKGCMCIEGYVGKQCSSAICTENYCAENGICVSNGLNLKCVCDSKITSGDRCELKCPKRCVNGECMFTDERVPKCQCISGYAGEKCDVRDFTILISFVLAGVAGLCAILLIVSLIIFVTAKFCFRAEGNAEDYIYRVENAIKDKQGDWNALKVN